MQWGVNSAFISEDFVVPHAIYLFQNRGKHETLNFCLVGGVERLENEKLVGGWKSGRIENIWFFFVCVWLEGWKNGRVENSFIWLKRTFV